ncbi:type II toxin-antitoxin system RelB/DinJ family antitoxin [Streptococcus gallolyticus]|uniref:type II toxin-antitoxin system RelB/DinJ family antitoxin n=1 Tax=Streptococcus gallolyticus TaxID=315405 RepID=UPI000210B81C|nr:type II toxin-antitoxin system RelB/DinJ family antitoxin [Streptococcus gallolyticus]MCF2565946.1 type II toxin-antitoxin system RelB/DinJ family antitoxin [Streptococcus pasteurianus]BAK27037.1 DNA-damage-inducible protein J [Streptococcus gallolyticus subsp. gallolyticus ATCC 43143]
MATITFKIDDKTKKEASELYESMGLDLSSALRLFIKQSLVTRSIPFVIKADELTPVLDDVKEFFGDENFSEYEEVFKD